MVNFRKLTPFILPTNPAHVRSDSIDFAIVCTCSLLSRITNVLTPLLLRRIVDKLASPATALPVADIVVFVLLRQVVNDALASLFWTKLIRVESDISSRLMCDLYDRVLALSADYHDVGQPADIYRTVTDGGPRFARFAMSIAFDKTSALIDLVVAMFTFQRIFGGHLALTMAVIGAVYVWASIALVPQRSKPFASALKLHRQRDEMGSDVLRHWHAVAAFNNVGYEQARYRSATTAARDLRGQMMVAHRLLGLQRNGIMAVGLLVLALLAGVDIKAGEGATTGRSVGDFIMLLQYWSDLAYPIQNFCELDELV